MAKQSRELLFLKSTGVFIGELTSDNDKSKLDLTKFDTKIVELDESLGEYWYGDFASGEIRARTDKPVITESYVRYTTNVTVLDKYPIHSQLNIIIDMLAQSDIPKTEKFTEMKEFLDTIRATHQEQIAAYSTNTNAYTWVSLEEEKNTTSKKLNLE
jgi:hypothetical protein